MSATDDVRDDTSPATSAVPVSEPASAADTIRGAFLKHAIDAERQESGRGLGDGDAAAGSITLRGAFVSRLTTTGPGAIRGGGTGEGETLRSVYAARFAALVEPTRTPAPRRGAKKARAKPARAKPARAKPARAKPARAKPARAKPARAKPARAKPAKKAAAKPKKVTAKAKKPKAKAKPAKRAKAAAARKPRKATAAKRKPAAKPKAKRATKAKVKTKKGKRR